eukprot:5234265-Lingulodinium_polyedra.AAC.1
MSPLRHLLGPGSAASCRRLTERRTLAAAGGDVRRAASAVAAHAAAVLPRSCWEAGTAAGLSI